MSKIFIHIPNNHIQIDDFVFKASDLQGIIEIPKYDSKYFEIQYNEDKLQPNYVKYREGSDIYINSIPKNIISFCKDFLTNKDKYLSLIKQKKESEIIDIESPSQTTVL